MKLKNKKTGEIGKILKQLSEDNQLEVITDNKLYVVKSLAELNEEWEDYEEKQLGYWYYDTTANRVDFIDASNVSDEDKKLDQQIGNYFETREEAEKAVEKLKAWKRLKDKGFKFRKWDWDDTQGHYILKEIDFVMDEYDGAEKDLDLLFSGR